MAATAPDVVARRPFRHFFLAAWCTLLRAGCLSAGITRS